jgi:hypothetical protein
LGGLVHFPRGAARRSEAEPHDAADDAVRSTRKTSDMARITWIDVQVSSDGDDDSDGGGGRAA